MVLANPDVLNYFFKLSSSQAFISIPIQLDTMHLNTFFELKCFFFFKSIYKWFIYCYPFINPFTNGFYNNISTVKYYIPYLSLLDKKMCIPNLIKKLRRSFFWELFTALGG